MLSLKKNIVEQNIFSEMAEYNLEQWDYSYEKYDPFMYGIICKPTNVRTIPGGDFKIEFRLKEEKTNLSEINYSLYSYLLMFRQAFEVQQ